MSMAVQLVLTASCLAVFAAAAVVAVVVVATTAEAMAGKRDGASRAHVFGVSRCLQLNACRQVHALMQPSIC